jgi:hypothetical protein
MALIANYKHPFGTTPAYQFVSKVALDRMSGRISTELSVHVSAADRAAWKVADASVVTLSAAVSEKHDAVAAAETELATVDGSDPASVATATAKLDAAQQALVGAAQDAAQAVATRDAARPLATYAVEIQSGEVPVAASGAVALGDIYAYLKRSVLIGSEDA